MESLKKYTFDDFQKILFNNEFRGNCASKGLQIRASEAAPSFHSCWVYPGIPRLWGPSVQGPVGTQSHPKGSTGSATAQEMSPLPESLLVLGWQGGI